MLRNFHMITGKEDAAAIVERFADISGRMEQAEGDALVDADREFHETLTLFTENRLLITIMNAVSEVYRVWIDIAIGLADDREKQELLNIHREIWHSVLKRDSDTALMFVDRHYDLIEKLMTR